MSSGMSVPTCGIDTSKGIVPALNSKSMIAPDAARRLWMQRRKHTLARCAQLALQHHLLGRLDVRREEAVGVEECYLLAQFGVDVLQMRRGGERTVEVDALRRRQQLNADDDSRIVRHIVQTARRERRHTDVVFLIRGSRDAVDAGRMRQRFVFRRSAAAVTWAIMKPELTPGSPTRNGGRPDKVASISSAMRRSEMLPISAMASASVSAAKATGSAWKFPPETTTALSPFWKISGLSVTALASMSSVRAALAIRSMQAPITCGWQRRQYGSCTRSSPTRCEARMALSLTSSR